MNNRFETRWLAPLVVVALLGFAAGAAAQDPEQGDWSPPPQQQQQPQQQQGGGDSTPWYQGGSGGNTQASSQTSNTSSSSSSASSSASNNSAPEANGRDNHMSVIGRAGLGFVGVNDVPMGDLATFVTAPTLGVRYWFSEMIGLDVGIGIGYVGGNIESGGTSSPVDDGFAMTIHGGVPIALFHDSFYTFQLIPELNLGFSSGTIYGPTPDSDVGRSGFLFSLGARAGAEIQFGFMGIPNLSLMATVGLAFNYLTGSLSPRGGSSSSQTVFNFGTSLQGEPWDIFVGSLTAFYYFG